MVFMEPAGSLIDSDGTGIVLLGAVEQFAVSCILGMHLTQMLGHGITGGEDLRIPFLTTNKIPLVELLAIVFTADFKVVIVVGDHVAGYTVVPHQHG